MIIGGRLTRCLGSLRPACMVALWIVRLLVAQHTLSAQEVVLHRFVSRNPDPRIERLLYLAAGTELEHAGISSTRMGNNANYVLLARYSHPAGEVTVDYTLMANDNSKNPLASAKTTIPLDQNLAAAIAVTVGKLLTSAGIKARSSPKAEIEGVLPASLVPAVTPNVPAEAARPDPSPAPAAIGRVRTSRIAPNPATLPPPPVGHRGTPPRFDSTVSTAGALFFGQMTQYFHYGVAGSTTAGLSWRTKKTGFGLGARLSVVRALNDFGVVGGPLYLSTAGLNLHVGSGSGKPYRLSAELSGGAAFLTVASTQKTQTKTAPYGDIGLHAVVPIGKLFSLGASIRFLTIFDKGLLIIAAMPAIALGIG